LSLLLFTHLGIVLAQPAQPALHPPVAAESAEISPGAVPRTNAVAVADFEMTAPRAGGGDWAYGLADVLAIELQQRGVMLFERQQIRVVLGERRITASGLMKLRGNASLEIPDLQFLVTGSISQIANGQFHSRRPCWKRTRGATPPAFPAKAAIRRTCRQRWARWPNNSPSA
jgi:hypothetical protein